MWNRTGEGGTGGVRLADLSREKTARVQLGWERPRVGKKLWHKNSRVITRKFIQCFEAGVQHKEIHLETLKVS